MGDRSELLATIYTALGEGDVAAMRAHVVPDVEIVERLEVPGARVYRGVDEWEEGYAREAETIDHFGVELHGVEEIGTRAIADVTIRLRGKGSGAEVSERLAHLVDFDGGKVARWRAFSDLGEARAVAMTEEIAELYELYERGRLAEAMERVHDEFESVEPQETIGAQRRQGREAAIQGITDWQATFDSFENETMGIEVVDGCVLVTSVQRVRGGGSSVQLESDLFHVWEFRDGLPARFSMYYEREQALEAARR